MQYVAIFTPAFIACWFQEKLEKESYQGSKLVKMWGIYTFFINFFSMAVYQYVLKTPNSWTENFSDNKFIIHYMILGIIMAVLLPIVKAALNPFVSIHIERKDTKEDDLDGEKIQN